MTSPRDNEPVVHIVILNWNGVEDTLECVSDLLESAYPHFVIHLVDNGSDGDDESQLRSAFSDGRVRVSANPTNLGFARGVNQAVQEILDDATVQFVALLNNDTSVDPQWLGALVQCARDHDAALVASRMVNYFDRGVMDNAGHLWLNTGEILPRLTGQPVAAAGTECHLVGACAGAALYRADMLREIGLFDEYFSTGYEDAEHGLRAFLCGYETVYCPDAVVYHKVSQSLDKVRDFDYAVSIQKNIHYTWLKLTPLSVAVLNSPFILLKLILVPLTAALFGRGTLMRAHVRANAQTVRDFRLAMKARREWQSKRRAGIWKCLRFQKFFVSVYAGYFFRYMLTGRKTVFER